MGCNQIHSYVRSWSLSLVEVPRHLACLLSRPRIAQCLSFDPTEPRYHNHDLREFDRCLRGLQLPLGLEAYNLEWKARELKDEKVKKKEKEITKERIVRKPDASY